MVFSLILEFQMLFLAGLYSGVDLSSGSVRSSHQTRSPPKFVFVFSAENGLFGNFRIFSFSAENEFSLSLYFPLLFQKCNLHWAKNVMFATEP